MKRFIVSCSILLAMVLTRHLSVFAGVIETCHTETFNAECADDEVIVMTSARYGRMKIGRCVKRDVIGDLGCQTDVLSILDTMCSGRRSCKVRIPDAELDNMNKCNDELKSYLEASYTCYKVVAPMNPCSDHTPIRLVQPSGFLSSYVASSTGCGLEKAPWILRAKPGQLINITFYEFNIVSTDYRDYGSATESQCSEHAFIMDNFAGRKIKICPRGRRISEVYVSTNNTLDITLRTDSILKEGNHFLLHYQFIGCPDKMAPSGMIFERTGTMSARLSCLNSQQRFDQICEDEEWTGEIENCTVPGLVSQDETNKKSVLNGLLVVVLIAVCLVLICIIVAIFVFCVKKLRSHNEPLHDTTYDYDESPYGKIKMHASKCGLKQLHVEMETHGPEDEVIYKPFIHKVPPNGMIQNQISNGECLLCGEQQGSREMLDEEQNMRNTYGTTRNPRVFYNTATATANYSPKESNIENDKRLKMQQLQNHQQQLQLQQQQQQNSTGTGKNNRQERPNSIFVGGNNKQKTIDTAQTLDNQRVVVNQTFDLDPSAMYPRNYACTPVKRQREPIYVTPPSVDMLNNTL